MQFSLDQIFSFNDQQLDKMLECFYDNTENYNTLLEKRNAFIILAYNEDDLIDEDTKIVASKYYDENIEKAETADELRELIKLGSKQKISNKQLENNIFMCSEPNYNCKNIDTIYNKLSRFKGFTCFDPNQYKPIYVFNFDEKELLDMSRDNLIKLCNLYRIESTNFLQQVLFFDLTDKYKSLLAIDDIYIQRLKDEDLSNKKIANEYKKLKETMKYGYDIYLTDDNLENFGKEILCRLILFFYKLVAKYGYHNPLDENDIDTKTVLQKINKIKPMTFENLLAKDEEWTYSMIEISIIAYRAISAYTTSLAHKMSVYCMYNYQASLFNDEYLQYSPLFTLFSLVPKSPFDMVVYRYNTFPIFDNPIDEKNRIYLIKRVLSTSIKRDFAYDLNGVNKTSGLKLFVPKGTSCFILFNNATESEIIFPPGIKIKIYEEEKIKVFDREKIVYHGYVNANI